ncbi:MAG TPA: trypsin-like peptidase domain-containing protein [Nitrospira sp.]|nr:trypsin-like peptidase domain-containing protein [Nitrospira sp.]
MAAVPDPAMGSHEQAEPEERRTVGIFEKLAPATLFLSVTYDSAHPLASLTQMGVGAGFIVDDTGRALTNAHVVDGASTITATLYDGHKVKAELLGWDPISDVAVLQLEKHDSPFLPVKLGDSSQLRVGQHVLVVGNPFGLGFTLTSGIISGLGPGTSVIESTNKRLVQTTAPINPGNSGGPLVDSHGSVIGMATATLMGAQNIGFAIPINVAKDVLTKLRDQGTIERPWLGITGQFVTDEVQRLFALPLPKGMLVVDVDDGGPAVDAGLRSGTLHVTI